MTDFQAQVARELCALALDADQPNPWLPGHDLVHEAEQDFVFFAPIPAPGETVFIRSSSEHAQDDAAGSLLTQILDEDDRVLAEAWTNTAAAVNPNHRESTRVPPLGAESADEVRGADLLAEHLVTAHGPGSLRRFRVRIAAPVAATASTSCAERELQRYERDGERLADLALTCALSDGTVVAQAWATCAV